MKDKVFLGKINYTRSREAWSSRRLHKSKKEVKSIFQLCCINESYHWLRTHHLWRCIQTPSLEGCHGGRVSIHHEEWCVGVWTETWGEVSCNFQMAIQNQTWSRWEYWKIQGRFLSRGFSQKEGVNYDETFSTVAWYTSIRSIISIASAMGWKLHKMDVKTTFLNGIIEEEVYIEQP